MVTFIFDENLRIKWTIVSRISRHSMWDYFHPWYSSSPSSCSGSWLSSTDRTPSDCAASSLKQTSSSPCPPYWLLSLSLPVWSWEKQFRYFYKIVRYSKYLCTLSLPLAYVLTRTWVCSSKNEDTGSSVGYGALSVRTWGHIGHCLLTDVLLSLSLRTIHSQYSGTAGLQVAGCCRTGIK